MVACALLSLPQTGHARSRGISSVGCEGCHGSQEDASATLSPMVAPLGESTTLRFTVSDPNAEIAGVFIDVEETSGLSIPSGQRLAIVSGGISHTSPTGFSRNEVTYEVNWNVPSDPGAMRFVFSGVTGDGNGRNSNDEAFIETFDVVFGCEPQEYFFDFDGDGFGRSGSSRTLCAGTAPDGFSAEDTDCNDNDESVFPGADEYCNRRDDDCDGEVDENALPIELYPDADGDGFYSSDERLNGIMEIGCLPLAGYAAEGGDCNASNAEINPSAEEVCDQYNDEDCDGRVDERVRPICGVGWCRRESYSCSLEDCYPGDPVEETCNFMDDDCDGEVDEGELCPEGQQCLAGECRAAELGLASDASPQGSDPTPTPPSDEITEEEVRSDTPRGASCSWQPNRDKRLALLLGLAGFAALRRRRQFV